MREGESEHGDQTRRDIDTLEGIVASARSQANPEAWVRHRVREALERLDQSDRNPALVAEARHQLRRIEEQILARLDGGH